DAQALGWIYPEVKLPPRLHQPAQRAEGSRRVWRMHDHPLTPHEIKGDRHKARLKYIPLNHRHIRQIPAATKGDGNGGIDVESDDFRPIAGNRFEQEAVPTTRIQQSL